MTALRLSPAVAEAFPDALIAVVTATGLRGREPWPATTAAQEDLEQQLAAGTWAPADENDPRIQAWHTAYRSFGTNPRRIRPSVDALGRRLAKKGSLPRINPAVDSYNTVSVRHGLPAGAFDLAHVTGDIEIRYADGDEAFTPLGEPDTVETPKTGEIIYTDTTDVLTRHWNHRDAHRTRVTEDATNVVFVLETLHATRDEHLLKTAAGELQDLLTEHSAQSAVHYLSPAHPHVTIGGHASARPA
ncbi:B3/4 domain-containing protein [Kitasatospora sp. NPDC089509]|uniref:B3/B4 domain-containing protein n=1 Tax=Kitasatospora sp. NPDC089509 TaxID=3364079 RepID=UPI0037F564B6